ncbi:MAG TPA: hypothetical protein VFW73_01225, partial [Lacipirellulaceae bacterium]|nr:hypothetical protein [Lacipirellulaceae bacterium]
EPRAGTGNSNRAPNADQPQPTYHIDADRMQLNVIMKGQTTVPSTLTCDGNILIRDVSQTAAAQQPLEVRGGHLFVDQLETKAPHAILNGAHSGGSRVAQLSARGVTLLTDTVQMDGHENRMWSDGPGEATMLMARDLQGNASATPTPVKIQWQGGLQFDGQVITFDRDVVVTSADSTMHCDRMLATLLAPIKFGQHVEQTATSLHQVECLGRVTIDNLSRDMGGLTAHDRVQLGRLTINQQTGEVYGEGRGVISSTRYGAGLGPLGGAPAAPTRASTLPPAGASGSKLHFLRVEFHSGLKGNLYTREVTFLDRVRAVFGPVDSWEQELDLARPESLPPESMTLTSNYLRINEDPLSARTAPSPNSTGGKPMGPLQLQAQGDVRIDGQTLGQGEFTIQSDRASYDQAKDMFIVEGDERTPAKLWRRPQTGTMGPPVEARRFKYNRSTNTPQIDGFKYLEFGPDDLQKAQQTTPTRSTR